MEGLVMVKKIIYMLIIILVLLNGACLPVISRTEGSGDGPSVVLDEVPGESPQEDTGDLSGEDPHIDIYKFFSEELQRAGVERVGQPIEGFSAFIYLEAFPGFEPADFDGVKSLEGVYQIEGGKLSYARNASNQVTSAEETISEEGYQTLLENFSRRVGVEVVADVDIATLLEKLREGDVYPNSYIHDDFSISLPDSWYPYDLGYSILFVHDPDLDLGSTGATEGFALAPYIQVIKQEIDLDVMFDQNLWTEGSEFVVSIDDVKIGNDESTRVLSYAAGASGLILHYVFDAGDGRVFTVSVYPYEAGSQDTDDFERAVQSFMINYVFD